MTTTADQTQPNIFLRSDTLFGACQGLADDLGINPLWIRVPLASVILFSPTAAFAAYAVLCVLVFGTRLLFPAKTVATEAQAVPVVTSEPQPANEQRELAEAA